VRGELLHRKARPGPLAGRQVIVEVPSGGVGVGAADSLVELALDQPPVLDGDDRRVAQAVVLPDLRGDVAADPLDDRVQAAEDPVRAGDLEPGVFAPVLPPRTSARHTVGRRRRPVAGRQDQSRPDAVRAG
jgi:hypothetical protein